jgi:hypothetical protein
MKNRNELYKAKDKKVNQNTFFPEIIPSKLTVTLGLSTKKFKALRKRSRYKIKIKLLKR